MEKILKLNVYKKGIGKWEIDKVYETKYEGIMGGTITELMDILPIEAMSNMKFDKDGIMENFSLFIPILYKSIGLVDKILADVFVGITDEELGNVKVNDKINTIVEIFKAFFQDIFSLAGEDMGELMNVQNGQ